MNTYAKKYAQCHLFRIASAPVRIANAQFPHCQLPCFCQAVSHSCIANTPFLYCQHTQCCHMVINSLIVNAPFLYCQHASSVLSPHHSVLPTHHFLPSGLPFPFRKPGSRLMPIRKEEPRNTSCMAPLEKRRRLPTLPHCIAVPSALVGLTSLFGMGRGGTPPQ